jgi:hypothetical protein
MNKKEALEIFLKVNKECIGKTCDDCKFYQPYCGENKCLFNFLGTEEISNGVEEILCSTKKSDYDKVKYTSTIFVPSTLSAEEFEKRLKAILPQHLALEPLPKEDRAIKMPESSKHDNVNCPKHYCKGGVESIEFVKAAVSNLSGFEAVCVANIIKYVWRYKEKNGLEDLQKAAKYLEWLQEEVQKNEKG